MFIAHAQIEMHALNVSRKVLAAARAAVLHAACARGRRADALLVVAARVRARLHAAQFSIEPAFVVGAVASNVNMEKLRTPRRGAAARRVGAFAAKRRIARVLQQPFSQLAARAVELLSQSVELRVHVHVLHDRHVRRGVRRELQRSRRGRRRTTDRQYASGAGASPRARHPCRRPGPRAAVARLAAVCVRRLPPRAWCARRLERGAHGADVLTVP